MIKRMKLAALTKDALAMKLKVDRRLHMIEV